MARVLVSAGNLHTQLQAHLGADTVRVRVGGGQCSLWSEAAITALPCESRWTGTALVRVELLLAALKGLEDQPITLDLHDALPCTLFAYARPAGLADHYEPITFDL